MHACILHPALAATQVISILTLAVVWFYRGENHQALIAQAQYPRSNPDNNTVSMVIYMVQVYLASHSAGAMCFGIVPFDARR